MMGYCVLQIVMWKKNTPISLSSYRLSTTLVSAFDSIPCMDVPAIVRCCGCFSFRFAMLSIYIYISSALVYATASNHKTRSAGVCICCFLYEFVGPRSSSVCVCVCDSENKNVRVTTKCYEIRSSLFSIVERTTERVARRSRRTIHSTSHKM